MYEKLSENNMAQHSLFDGAQINQLEQEKFFMR